MAKKNKIFSTNTPFVSKYYSKSGRKSIKATKKYRSENFGNSNDKETKMRKFAILMEALPDAVADEIRSESGEFRSSGDVLDATDYLVGTSNNYINKENLIEAMKTIRERNKQTVEDEEDPFDGLVF